MTIENGGEQPANDTAVAVENDTTKADQNTEAEVGEGEGEDGADDDEELDLDGEKFRIPRKVREAIARPFQQDYSRKTEEVAQGRKALDGEREQFKGQVETQKAHFQAATKVAAIEDRLAAYADVKDGVIRPKVNWANEYQSAYAKSGEDGGAALSNYHHHKAVYDQMVEDHRAAAGDFSALESKSRDNANRENGERVAKATAEIAKQVEGWAPGNELDVKLAKYGNSKGISDKDMAELAIRAPVLVKLLNEHRVFSEAAAKQKTQQTFEKTQQAQPVTRVGGAGGTATQRTTTNSSGDALSAEEWNRRENERVAKQRVRR